MNSTGTGTLGRTAQFFGSSEPVTVDSHVTIVRAKADFSALILGRLFERSEVQIESLGKGATNQKELGASDLAQSLKVTVPTLEKQKQFDALIAPLFEIVQKLSSQNALLKEARDLLLPRLMTGLVDIDDYLARGHAVVAAA